MSEQPAIDYADLLRALRTEAGFTQEELAEAAGVSPRTVSDLERGINLAPRRATAELLADALKLTGHKREHFMAARRTPLATLGAVSADASGPDDDADASNVVWIESAASATFVDRAEELGVLREAWSSAKAGHRVLTLIAGEPGIGKTALTAELARLVHADGGLVLYGRWDEHVLDPYRAFREALDDYARACPDAVLRQDLAGLAEEIARLCPEPAQRVGVSAAPAQAAAEAERFRLFESLDTWIRRIAARHPVLLVLDDLQWADQPSLFLLPHLMRAKRSTPLLTVAMYRDSGPERSEFSAALPSLARDVDFRRLSLRGLEHDAVTALLEDAAGRQFGERESVLVAELEWETAGNPFFLLEMIRHLSEIRAFDRDVVRLGETPAEIPQSVRDMVQSRLRRLPDSCTETLAIASLLGERFDAALLASAASLTEAATVDLLEEAARAGLIAEIDDEPDWWRFPHSLTRRVTSEELRRGQKALAHQRIGETLETRPGVSPAELAHHFGAAASKGSAGQAVRYGRLAGERALREVAAEVAVRHFRKALELLDRFGPEDQALRCELLLDLAGAYDRAGEYPSRDERFTEAADTAGRLGSGELFARAALGYGGVLPAAVRPDPRAQALLEEALKRLDEEDSRARATVLARLGHWLHNVRPYTERLELSDQAVAMARGAGDRRTLATVLLHRCWTLDGPADVGDALRVASEILDIGAELGDQELTLEGLRIRLASQFENGEYSAAVATARDMKMLAEALRHPEFIRLAAMWDIIVAAIEGRFEEAEARADELGRRLDQIGHPQASLISVAQSVSWRLLQGHATEYLGLFEALSAAEPANLAWPAILAWCLAETGARDRAADLLRRTEPASAADADRNYLWWAVIVGFSGAVDLVDDRRWAEALYELAAPYAGSNCTLGLASFLGAADHWLGVLAAAAGRFTEAIAHLEAALARHREMGARPWTALTEEAYGRVLFVRGQAADGEQAGRLAESAMRTAEELGLDAIINRPRLRAAGAAGTLPLVEEVHDPRVHVDGGPGPDDRVEMGVSVEHLPLVVAPRVVLPQPAQRLERADWVEDVIL
jgi:transcriptional regulator with XRE-family HTH domain/tetratricopeptide (TPR) repeat protein